MQIFVIDNSTFVDYNIKQLNQNIQDQYDELDTMQTSGFQAVAMLEALSEKSELTNSDLELMQSYADYLNDTFNCNIEVDYDTGKLTGFDPNILSDQLMQQYENQKIQISMDYVSSPEFVDGYTEIYNRLIEAQENYHNTIIRKEHEANALYEDYLDKKGTALEDSAYAAYETVLDEIDASKQAMDSIQDEFDKVDEQLKYHCSVIGDETGELYETITDSLKKATGSTIEFNGSLNDADDAARAAASAYQEYQSKISNICAAYDEAYESAYENFHGQFGLFDEASMKSEEYLNSTVANAQAALDSQLAYWENYTANVEYMQGVTASQLGVTQTQYDTLMSYIQTGTPEAIALVDDIQQQIESGNTEAVAELAQTIENVETQQQAASDATADWITDFSGQMDDLVIKMGQTIDEMDLSSEAKAAAKNTISSYANSILSGKTSAVSAAKEVANAVSLALSSTNTTVHINTSASSSGSSGSGKPSSSATATKTVPAHATGTVNVEDVFIAGENGPELIVGKAGSTVFPTSETDRIISAFDDMNNVSYSNSNSYSTSTANNYSNAIENIDRSETINNYTSVEETDIFDDAEIVSILDGFMTIFKAIEHKINQDDILPPSGFNGESETHYVGDEISNYDDSITYGDDHNFSVSYDYNTDYGGSVKNSESINNDNRVSRTMENIDNYNNSINSFEEIISSNKYISNSAASAINNNNLMSVDNAYDDSKLYKTSIDYGDAIRRYEENISNNKYISSHEISSVNDNNSTAVDNVYDNSHLYKSSVDYGDAIRRYEENIVNVIKISYLETSQM